jgi:methylaspartate mutase sigma subunit
MPVLRNKQSVVITSTPSDSHTWNLLFLELLFNEEGFTTHNLGCCVPITDLMGSIYTINPDLIVISSLNGLLYLDLEKMMLHIKKFLMSHHRCKLLVGGNLSTHKRESLYLKKRFLNMGIDRVFDGKHAVKQLKNYLSSLNNRTLTAAA